MVVSMAGMEIFGWSSLFLTLFIGIYEYVVYKKNIFVAHPLNKVFLAIALAMFISVITTPFADAPGVNQLYHIGKIRNLIFFTLHIIIFNRLFSYQRALKVLLYFMLPVVVYALLQKFTGFDPITGNYKMVWSIKNIAGIRELFNMYLTYINVFQFHFFIILSFAVLGKIKMSLRLFLILLSVLFLTSFVFSNSRAIIVAVVFGTIAQTLLSKKLTYFIIILATLMAPIIAYKTSTQIKMKADRTISNIDQLGDKVRFKVFKTHLQMFKDYPIKGVGYGINEPITRLYYEKMGIQDSNNFQGHSHNIIVQMLSGTGLIGTIPFLLLWIMVLYMIIKSYNFALLNNDYYHMALCNGLFGGFISFLVNGMAEWNFGDYETNHNLMFFIAIVGYIWLKQVSVRSSLKQNNPR